MKKLLSLVPVYLFGMFIAVCVLLLRVLEIWKIKGVQNFPTRAQKGDRGLIIVSNHPSLLEPIALLALCAHWYVFTLKYGPWNIAETKNFRRGLFRLMEPRLLFVDRKSKLSRFSVLRQATELLQGGAIFLLFPEGGRTSSVSSEQLIVAKNGARIRSFEVGAGFLAIKTKAMVVPVWVEGTDKVSPNRSDARYSSLFRFWKPVTVTIGKPVIFAEGVTAEQATRYLEKTVLDLAT